MAVTWRPERHAARITGRPMEELHRTQAASGDLTNPRGPRCAAAGRGQPNKDQVAAASERKELSVSFDSLSWWEGGLASC